MININWRREELPLFMLGRVEPTLLRTGRQTITIEVTHEDGEGTIIMTDEQQLYRLYQRLHEFYYPQTISIAGIAPPAESGIQPNIPGFTEIYEAPQITMPPEQVRNLRPIIVTTTIADDPTDQESILEFMEK